MMNPTCTENTLFLGNGFSRSIFDGMPSWEGLFDQKDRTIGSYTLMYESLRISKGKEGCPENELKETLIEKIKNEYSQKSVKADITDLACFGEYLRRHHVSNIITTNYDQIIEWILCEQCGYSEQEPKDMVPEEIYSIRTYKEFSSDTGHTVKLWKIHGDLDRIKSVTLGYDQYCGSLAKLSEYMKGEYAPAHYDARAVCDTHMIQKCRDNRFDHISWAELFFHTNVYFVGFGMDFLEIDIWWMLNKRARFMLDVPQIQNKITYLYNSQYDTEEKKGAVFAALKAFDVELRPLEAGDGYLKSIFSAI